MAKLSNLTFTNSAPDWNATGAEPPATLKSNGFQSGYKPPAAFFNWFWTKCSKCISEIHTKINSIVSFLTADDFVLYKDNETITSLSNITSLAVNTTYRNNDYILQFTVAGNAAVFFDLPAAMAAEMRFIKGNAYIVFINGWSFRYNYVNSTWVRIYADVDRNLTYFPRVRRFDTNTCGTLADAYSLYTNYKDNYDIVYFETSGLNAQCGAIGRIDCLLGQLTFSGSEATWVIDTANTTFVLNVNGSLSNYYTKSEAYAKTETYSKTEVDTALESYYTKNEVNGKVLKREHAFLNRTAASAATLREKIVNAQTDEGRLYMSGTDFIEYVDLESTANVEVLDMVNTTGTSAPELTMLSEPSNTYLIQTWHKYDGTVVSRFKIGSGSWSAWA